MSASHRCQLHPHGHGPNVILSSPCNRVASPRNKQQFASPSSSSNLKSSPKSFSEPSVKPTSNVAQVSSQSSFFQSLLSAVELVATALSIYLIYITYGIYHEKITQYSYNGEKFSASFFLTGLQCSANTLWSLILILYAVYTYKQPKADEVNEDDELLISKNVIPANSTFSEKLYHFIFDNVPKSQYVIVACSYSIAMLSSTAALGFLPYLFQALTKSSKLIPVMIGKFLRGHRYSLREYIHVFLITIGIALFIFDPYKHQKDVAKKAIQAVTDDPQIITQTAQYIFSPQWNQAFLDWLFPTTQYSQCAFSHPTAAYTLVSAVLQYFNTIAASPTLIGSLLIILSLSMDAITGPTQDSINQSYAPNLSTMCFWINLIPAVGLFTLSIITGEFFYAINFLTKHQEIIPELVIYCFLAAIGQTVILYALLRFNSMTLTIITTTRKFFSIIASVLWFGHALLPSQWVGVALVFSGIIADSQFKFVRQQQRHALELLRNKESKQLPHMSTVNNTHNNTHIVAEAEKKSLQQEQNNDREESLAYRRRSSLRR